MAPLPPYSKSSFYSLFRTSRGKKRKENVNRRPTLSSSSEFPIQTCSSEPELNSLQHLGGPKDGKKEEEDKKEEEED